MLAGRLGDLTGRGAFPRGLVTFTAASLLCGIAQTQAELIGARLLQGVGAAAQASVILAIIVTEFPERRRARPRDERVRVRLRRRRLPRPVAGGLLTGALSWHWVFFVNLPIGALTFAAARADIRSDQGAASGTGWTGWARCSSPRRS